MVIGILTHYSVNNQGAQLQMLSMSKWLEAQGHTVKILQYVKNFDFDKSEEQKNSGSVSNFTYYIKNYLLAKGAGLTLFNIRKVMTHKRFLQRYSFLPYDSGECDAIIIGSDEVFSIDVGCNKMMYGHGLRGVPAIAYAPAFGRTTEDTLREFGCYELAADGLKNMYSLSARDAHTREMILSLTGREAPLVCDPVLLYSGADFHVPVRPIRKPYMVVYAYDSHMIAEEEVAAIRAYAKRHGLITVSLGTYHRWCDRNIVCDAVQWYAYFRDAACVVTDTFHGTVVAMKNHCNLAVFVRESINKFKLLSLLEETGLSARRLPALSAENLEVVLSVPIDYAEVEKRLAEMTARSEAYLKNALDGIHE